MTPKAGKLIPLQMGPFSFWLYCCVKKYFLKRRVFLWQELQDPSFSTWCDPLSPPALVLLDPLLRPNPIREKYNCNKKSHFTDVLVVGKGPRKGNRKMKDCYIVHIPEFDDGTKFHIVNKNFKVHTNVPNSKGC